MASIEARASHVFTSGKDSRTPDLRGPQEFAEPKPVVRVFAVAPIPVEEFLENLKRGYTPFFSEVIISQKSHVSKPSPDNLTAVGGAIEPGESVVEAGLAEFAEEATGYTVNIDGFKQYWMSDDKPRIAPYIYRPPGEAYQEGRKVYLTVVPFVSRSFALYEVREGGHGATDKMKHMLQFTPEGLGELFEKGSIQLSGGPTRIEGHLTKVPSSEIAITPRQARKRNKALDQVLKEVWRFEHLLREETLAQINRIRAWKHQSPASSLEGCSRSETVTGFVAAQMRLGLYDERLRDLTGKESPPPKKDLLKFIQYVIGVDSEQLADLLLARPTREVLHGTNLLKRAMRRAIVELYPTEQRQELQALIRISDLRSSLPGYIWRPLRKIMEKATGRRWFGLESVNLYGALADIWPQVLAMPLPLRVEAFARANKRLVAEIARMQGIAKSDVYDALRAAEDTSEHINQSMQREFIIKSLRGEKERQSIYFQDHRPLDEVANAKLFTLAIMAFGFHPNIALNPVDRHKIQQTLKFESWRVLSAFLAGLDRIPAKVKYADNSLFEGAIDSFFHWPPELEIIDLSDGILHPVYHYRSQMVFNGREIHLIKDERMRKTEARAEIKAFQSANLNDVYSTNLVIADDNFPNAGPEQIETRLQLADAIRETLLLHIRGQVEPYGWKVSILEGTHDRKSYERLRDVLNLPADQREAYMATFSGDRAGSKGDLIIRDKFILEWQRNGETFTNEVCIYPFEHMECGMALELKQCGFWGFKEKLRDDAIGDYPTTRLYARDMDRPTDPSVYELYYPGPLYESLAVRMMRRQMQKRRRAKRSG